MFRNPVTDLLIVVVVALLIFGPKRLPMLGRSLGQGLREFKEGITGDNKHNEDEHPALTAASSEPVTQPTTPAATPEPAPAAPSGAESESAAPVAQDHRS
jgi:sec-independent protein translocase protein TatA